MGENNLRPLNDKELDGILDTILPLLAALNAEGYCLGEVEEDDGRLTHVFSSIAEVTKIDRSPTPVLPLSEALKLMENFSEDKSFEKTAFEKIANMIVRLLLSVEGLEEDVLNKVEDIRKSKMIIN